MLKNVGLLLALILLASPSLLAQEEHAQFVLLGKTANHRQSADGELTFLNTVFFGEIFLREGAMVTNGYVTGPGDAKDPMYFGDGEVLFFSGNRHPSVQELNEHFPDGTYYFYFDTPDGNVRDLPVTLSSKGQSSRHPGPIRLTLYQNGRLADPNAVDPTSDLRVVWSEFKNGAADPTGLIDDMIYAMMGNCLGEQTVHSGHAFEEQSITYVAKEFTIPKESLHGGQVFQVEVEFSEMDTGRHDNIPTIVTHAASTFLDIRTTGKNEQGIECPEHPYAMDGGQTDRIRKPK